MYNGLVFCEYPTITGIPVILKYYTRGGNGMAGIKVGANESIDSALRRFKRETSKSGVLAEIKKRKHYEKPSVKRKKKSEAARRKNKKKAF